MTPVWSRHIFRWCMSLNQKVSKVELGISFRYRINNFGKPCLHPLIQRHLFSTLNLRFLATSGAIFKCKLLPRMLILFWIYCALKHNRCRYTPLVCVFVQAQWLGHSQLLVAGWNQVGKALPQTPAVCFVTSSPKTSSFWLSVIGNKMFSFNVNFLIPYLHKVTKKCDRW